MTTKLKILSYNIWFDDYIKDDRTASLIYNIKILNPDIICLQEVTKDAYEKIKKELNYYRYPEELDRSYGVITLSKYKIINSVIHDLISNMGRTISIIEISVKLSNNKEETIIITNCHYESEFNKENIIKIKQFKDTEEILEKFLLKTPFVIHCADTNIVNNEDKFYFQLNGWKDCWIENKCDEYKKFTYDYDTNENLQSRNLIYRSRIDRMIYSNTKFIELLDFKLIVGDKDYIQPSDHHGIMAVFNIENTDVLDQGIIEI
jgi:exonuclease III